MLGSSSVCLFVALNFKFKFDTFGSRVIRLDKKQWVEKKKPQVEEEQKTSIAQEKEIVALRDQNEGGRNVQSIEPSNETMIAETEDDRKEEGIGSENEGSSKHAELDEVPWTTVKTRNRSRTELIKGTTSMINNQASKANG
ncbi:hypothetical protein RIF29_39689 [Crotalaria pallida]|uniref:Uncharacterized protein n=1 Tax=Crotalaria pallida TaxID=3830 RepID=A0AAN9HQ04_CROPI